MEHENNILTNKKVCNAILANLVKALDGTCHQLLYAVNWQFSHGWTYELLKLFDATSIQPSMYTSHLIITNTFSIGRSSGKFTGLSLFSTKLMLFFANAFVFFKLLRIPSRLLRAAFGAYIEYIPANYFPRFLSVPILVDWQTPATVLKWFTEFYKKFKPDEDPQDQSTFQCAISIFSWIHNFLIM